MSTTIFGISNCDTVRKARKWLEQANIEFNFHDVRKDGLQESDLQQWLKSTDWEVLLNKRGLTWRKLDESQKEGVDATNVIALLLEQPTLIKRPVLLHNGTVEVGFKPERYQEIFA